MSKTDFDSKKASIEAIPGAEVSEPNMPVAVALQEGEDLCEWAQDDKELLTAAGLDVSLLEDLPQRLGALRYAQSVWQKEYKSLEEAEKEWLQQAPEAFDLRDTLVHHCLFAYHNYSDLLSKAQKIAEGSGNADMVQDLSDLAVLGKANPEPLTAIGVDMALFDQAEELSEVLPDLLAKTNGDRMSDNATKITRDKAFSYVKQAVDEIRRVGKYRFWRNDARLKGYVSRYFQKKNADAKAKKAGAAKQ